MEYENTQNSSWLSKHKKGIIITAAVLSVTFGVAGAILIFNNRTANRAIHISSNRLIYGKSFSVTTPPHTSANVSESACTEVSEAITESVTKRAYTPYAKSFTVKGGPVRLRPGCHPSPEKSAIGDSMGLNFDELHITWRNDYRKKGAA